MFEHLKTAIIILGPLIFAFIVSRGICNKAKEENKEETIKNYICVFDLLASILIPFIIFNVIRKAEINYNLWKIVFVGFFLPIFTYVVTLQISKVKAFRELFVTDHIIKLSLFSTFGGGNRGYLLILVAFSQILLNKTSILEYYILLDLGNLICLLLLGNILVKRITREKNTLSFGKMIESIFRSPIFYSLLLVISKLPLIHGTEFERFIISLYPFLDLMQPYFSGLFSFIIFLSIFLRLENLSDFFARSIRVLYCFVVSRITTILFSAIFLLFMFHLDPKLLIPFTILALMPPSSILWSWISKTTPNPAKSQHQDVFYLIPNLFYFFLLSLAIIWRLISSFLIIS